MAERDFNLEMTGEQVKDALQQLEDRVAEGWAVGEKDGTPVTSGSPYYENNAKYYAEQAGLSATAAASSAATAEQEVEEGIRQGIVGTYVQESATPGAIVTIDDGADDVPLKDLKVNLDIVQPGTGDPSPSNVRPIYPVTEAEVIRTGKNLLNPAEFHLDRNYDGASFTGRAVFVQKMRNETVTISASNGTAFTEITVGRSAIPYPFPTLTSADLKDAATITNNGTKTLTFEDIHPYLYVFLRKSATISENDIIFSQLQLERGSTATTYTPYAGQQYLVNIGIQQWDEDWEVGTINNDTGVPEADANNIRSANFCPCIEGTQYNIVSKDSKVLRYYFYDKDETFISGGATSGTNTIVTAPTGACYFKVRTTSSYGSTYLSDISVNFPARFTEYRAYTGNVVYGGELDVTTGALTSKYGMVDLGSLTWTYDSTNLLFKATMLSPVSPNACFCSSYAYSPYTIGASRADKTINAGKPYFDSSNRAITVKDTAYTDPAVFKTAMSGVQLVYELATPISIQLTPTEVDTLRGDNVIFCDAGDITNCEYRADLKMYIDKVVGA